MWLLLFFCFSQFTNQYKEFLKSPKSDSIFVGLTRHEYKIADFAEDPAALWYWRSETADPMADSLLRKLSLRKNFYLSAVLRWEAKESNNYDTISNKLALATHLDSVAIENFLSQIALSIRYRNFSNLPTTLSLPILSDFRNQILLLTNLVILILGAMTMAGIIYVLVKIIYYTPVLNHRLDPQKHTRTKGLIAFVLLLIPVLILRHLYPIFICYAILLILVANGRETNWLRVVIIIMLLFFALPLPLDHFIFFLRGHSRSYQIYEVVNYDSDNILVTNSDKEQELLAYALKQQGQMDKALGLYEDLYRRGDRNVAVINNLANVYFHFDQMARAETLYNNAIQGTGRGEPYFNMGLLKLKKIEYLESSRYMTEAQKRSFSSVNKEPVDIKPTNDDFYKITLAEKLPASGMFNRRYAIPLLVIFLLTFLPFRLAPPLYCKTCGRAVCADCIKEIEKEIVCAACFTKFKTTKNVEMEESLKSAVNQGRRRLRRVITYLLNIAIPGAGVIYQGKNFVGLIIVSLVMVAYGPLFFPHFFIKPSGWISLPLTPIFISVAVVIAFIAYLWSFSVIRGSHAD